MGALKAAAQTNDSASQVCNSAIAPSLMIVTSCRTYILLSVSLRAQSEKNGAVDKHFLCEGGGGHDCSG